jgi:undecaprenyl-diphosphatase
MTPSSRPTGLAWLRARGSEATSLLLVLVVSGAVWGFIAVASEVREGETRAVDRAIVLGLRHPQDLADPLGPPWFEETMRDFTALGGAGVLGLFTLAAAGFLWIDGKPRGAWFVCFAVAGGLVLSTLLKHVFQRPRPDLVPHGSIVFTTSFPSGHAMLSAVTYLTLGALLARLHERERIKVYVLGVAVVLTVLVGSSRVYLGVHWPTDVLAGWAAGAAWAALCSLAARALQRKGTMEGRAGD